MPICGGIACTCTIQRGDPQTQITSLLAGLKQCTRTGDLERGKLFHIEALQTRVFHDTYVFNSLITMYSKCGDMPTALQVFTSYPELLDIVSWTCMIQGYTDNGQPEKALHLYDQLVKTAACVPNPRTYVAALTACGALVSQLKESRWLEKGKEIHARAASQGCCNVFVECALMFLYGSSGCMELAERVFQKMSHRNSVAWTALLQGYIENGERQLALDLFENMDRECDPSGRTYALVLAACSGLATEQGEGNRGMWLKRGKSIHLRAEMNSCCNIYVESVLVDMYGKCGALISARIVFDSMLQPNFVTWTSLMNGYVANGETLKAVKLFFEMEESGCLANSRTFVIALTACASLGRDSSLEEKAWVLKTGRTIHSKTVRRIGCREDMFVQTALINVYSVCGEPVRARTVFDSMETLNVVSWNSMIQAYGTSGGYSSALSLLSEMKASNVKPDSATYIALLTGSGGSLARVSELHEEILSLGLDQDVPVANCLIDAYGKYGSMSRAREVFERTSRRNLVSWNTLMNGYTQQGYADHVFELFERLREQGVAPDKFTFTHLLTACSHAGLTERGREYFNSMSSEYGVTPDILHYTCLVDLLGRANFLEEAVRVLKTMPVQPPSASVWSTLLGACRKWRNKEIGELAFRELVKMDCSRDTALAYSLMSS